MAVGLTDRYKIDIPPRDVIVGVFARAKMDGDDSGYISAGEECGGERVQGSADRKTLKEDPMSGRIQLESTAAWERNDELNRRRGSA
jgi:hypothetical protein